MDKKSSVGRAGMGRMLKYGVSLHDIGIATDGSNAVQNNRPSLVLNQIGELIPPFSSTI